MLEAMIKIIFREVRILKLKYELTIKDCNLDVIECELPDFKFFNHAFISKYFFSYQTN